MKKKIIGLSLIFLIIILSGFWLVNKTRTIDVETIAVKTGNIRKSVEEVGVAKTRTSISIFNSLGGRVAERLVELGDYVEAGDVLVKIDSEDLDQEIDKLESQQSALIAKYKESLSPADSREIHKMELQLDVHEKRLAEMEERREANRILYEAGAISSQEYKNIVTETEIAMIQRDSIMLDLELLKNPDLENMRIQFEEEVYQLDIELRKLQKKKEETLIVSPVNGTIVELDAELGSYMQPGMALAKIGDLEDLYIESDILVGEIGNVSIGRLVKISHKDLNIQDVRGSVSKIYPGAFSQISDLGIEQKRVKVEIDIEEAVKGIGPGYDLDIEIITHSKDGVLLIPSSAVFEYRGKDHVFINVNKTASLKEIVRGIKDKKYVEVISGLEMGMEVIVSPESELKEGIKISPKSWNAPERE